MANIPFIFFGSSRLSVIVLDEMEKAGFIPALIVTTPDKPQGRKLVLTPNVVKDWANAKNIPVIDDIKKFDTEATTNGQVFVVASFGKIIPMSVLDLAPKGALNIHPSLLPIYRGASPLPTAMLDDTKNTGVSIMLMDAEMDHGPVIAQEEVEIKEWPTYEDFEEKMARIGAQLLAKIIPDYIAGKITPKEQDHATATYTKKIKKEDGLIDLAAGDPYTNFRKIQAYHAWPQAYFFVKKNDKDIRVKITQASYKNGALTIEKVIPEGSREMSYADFQRGM